MSAAEYRTGRFNDGEAYGTCLWRRGTTRLHVTYIGTTGISHRAIPATLERFIEPLEYRGGDYPLDRMVRRYRKIGRALGITEAARAELDRAVLVS